MRNLTSNRLAFVRALSLWVVASLAACAFAGCGGSGSGPKLVPVAGQALVNGTPVAGLGISFRPDSAKGNTSSYIPSGTTDAAGNYELVTAATKGAPVGWYKVVIIPPTPPMVAGEAPKVGPPPFDEKYADAAKTDLNIEVKAGEATGSYDLILTK